MNIAEGLRRRAAEGRPVRVGPHEAGEMGTDIVTQVGQMPGIEVAVVADLDAARAMKAFDIAGTPGAAVACDGARAVEAAIGAGRAAVVPDASLVAGCDLVDVVIDATGNPNVGAQVALRAMEAGKHIVMMNVEADVTIGAWLRRAAEKAGVVYTLGAGDEPSSAMELINFVQGMGWPVIAAGKGKNNPFRVEATPDEYREEAARRNMNPRMLVEFVDGSKTMIEMTAIANATGLVPDRPGMHGPDAKVAELHKVLCPAEDGGLLSRRGVVDFTVAKGVAPGVFVVTELRHPRLRERMHDLHLGEGPYYTFFRPYHLTSLEVPLSAAAAVLFRQSHMIPLERPVGECAALAKKDLPAGTRLDAIGEYCYRGWATTRAHARSIRAVPLGLAQGGTTTAPIRAGEYLTEDNCRLDETLEIVRLRRLQDRMLDGDAGAAP
ncbi:MAG: NAD(P)H-dependent oxidoreductase [Alphaproteobacteria bacterium]